MGISNIDQLKHNIKSLDLLLDEEILKQINQIHNEDRNPCV